MNCIICNNELTITHSNYFCSVEQHYNKTYFNGAKDSFYENMIYKGYYFDNDLSNNKLRVWKIDSNVKRFIQASLISDKKVIDMKLSSAFTLDKFINLSSEQILNKINLLKNFS